MLRKLPIISSSISFGKLLYALKPMCSRLANEELRLSLSKFTESKYIYLANSGISSFYAILKALKEKSKGKEVILPAYTAGSLVTAVIKAGLKPVLCDVSPSDFNTTADSLLNAVSPDTLAVVAVHMFGIGIRGIETLRERLSKDIFLIEDCAQSMGSEINGKRLGSFSDVSFFSFGRGKNLNIYAGGCIVTGNAEIAEGIEKEWKGIEEENLLFELSLSAKIFAFSSAANPLIYGLAFPFASRFKDTVPPRDFAVKKMCNLEAVLGLELMRRQEEIFSRRCQNGLLLINELKKEKGVIVPTIPESSYFVFPRLPILFEDPQKVEKTERRLWMKGIESSRMYLRSLHQMFDLGYAKEDFPNANYFAQRLLTLPVHPSVGISDLERIIEVIKET
ncbi:MAG: DegT/DnrJ/EryC1/StrS family aminotransferase [Candidatus Omnitrophica bacterium]|nr:DegT/DnrJ/EryC1/StrS family aminotransferase [Candidatus Omnitrophota bacterium]